MVPLRPQNTLHFFILEKQKVIKTCRQIFNQNLHIITIKKRNSAPLYKPFIVHNCQPMQAQTRSKHQKSMCSNNKITLQSIHFYHKQQKI